MDKLWLRQRWGWVTACVHRRRVSRVFQSSISKSTGKRILITAAIYTGCVTARFSLVLYMCKRDPKHIFILSCFTRQSHAFIIYTLDLYFVLLRFVIESDYHGEGKVHTRNGFARSPYTTCSDTALLKKRLPYLQLARCCLHSLQTLLAPETLRRKHKAAWADQLQFLQFPHNPWHNHFFLSIWQAQLSQGLDWAYVLTSVWLKNVTSFTFSLFVT